MKKKNTMEITVKLFASLQNGRFKENIQKYPSSINVRHVVEGLKIPHDEVFIIFVNNKHAGLEFELSDNDVLALFPPIGGG